MLPRLRPAARTFLSVRFAFALTIAAAGYSAFLFADDVPAIFEWKSGIEWETPPRVESPVTGNAPSDATVLFDGISLDAWNGGENWQIRDGYAEVHGNDISTKAEFGDVQLHLEWASPAEVSGDGQGRGNSGVFLMDRFEVQVLDSFNNPTYVDGQAGSLYKTAPPLVNVTRGPAEWQTYDILFTAPRFDEAGTLLRPGYVTVMHNGVCVQNHTELLGDTKWHVPPSYERGISRGRIRLQNHGNPVRYRNIWIRDLKPLAVKYPERTAVK